MMGEIIRLNVGGVIYQTTRATLTTYSESMLGAMFSGEFGATKDEDGNYFIDRDGEVFKYVLNFLRSNKLTLPQGFTNLDLLISEAEFYQILPLIEALKYHEKNSKSEGDEKLFIEIFETRQGSYNDYFLTQSDTVRTLVIGGMDILCAFPPDVIKPSNIHKLLTDKKTNVADKFGELELTGRMARMQLIHYLYKKGWRLEHTEMSSSSGGQSKVSELGIREVWSRVLDKDFEHGLKTSVIF